MTAHREQFHDYVSTIVARFKDDPRIAFWQLYNEAMGARENVRTAQTDANIARLLAWTRDWVKSTGTQTPVTATGGAFFGPQLSDFPTYHSYRLNDGPLPGADGGIEHLCTETLDRPNCTLIDCLDNIAAKHNGFVVWELMIGRDNCRFPWGHPDGTDEPTTPFHGVIYPDGHPWDEREVAALLDDKAFASLKEHSFRVEYFDGEFQELKKTSITPRIDIDLGDEPGTGSPDASAAVPKDHFSIRWSGRLIAPVTGPYALHADADGPMHVWIDDALALDAANSPAAGVETTLELKADHPYQIRVEYVHLDGPAQAHLAWSCAQFPRQPLRLDTEFVAPRDSR